MVVCLNPVLFSLIGTSIVFVSFFFPTRYSVHLALLSDRSSALSSSSYRFRILTFCYSLAALKRKERKKKTRVHTFAPCLFKSFWFESINSCILSSLGASFLNYE
ncbi:hypothetical protein Droror1_Dr00001894 [Drosera rotundifolia]